VEFACSVRDLTRNFGGLHALRGISFDIKPGEVFGLIGPNGSGKTTTLRIVSTLLRPTSGTVSVFGINVADKPGDVRRLLSYLPEDAGAYKNLSGLDYLRFMATFYTQDNRDRDKMVEQGMELADLGQRIKNRVKTYSKGMARKLLLARALMTKPRLAILDEPTSGLDVSNSMGIRKRVREYAREGTTVLLSSHNMLEVEFLSDRVALIKQGEIIETGAPEELKQKHGCRNLEEVFLKMEHL
jgi:ABC-2 type transport system ATP-binding protein